ncbi:MAG TPA: phenylalanine--tRNA ligase subunit beta [Candidatus Magasanikbacteria bacterium]|nr:phenylalanine--tRNA ligase subunit beta [Candidatus Magasanikbacteria bacterium]
MLLSYKWIKEFVDLADSVTPDEVAARLKASTVEVEKVTHLGENLNKITVGRVISADAHPNADKLKVCQVDLGRETVQIVCGGSNVVANMLVAVAEIGARVRWHGEGELVELGPVKLRGVDSAGMICASSEIGLGDIFPAHDEKEILDLTKHDFKPGVNLAEALVLDDAVMEIENKSLSNRPDLWGHYGIAREVSVLFHRDLKKYETIKINEGKSKIKVSADAALAPRYMAVKMRNVSISPSPSWLVNKLNAVGVNAVNNIVDVTNFVMLELGLPLHAFDARSFPKDKIIVRAAESGEKIKTLDGKEYGLKEGEDIVIANDSEALCVAGVMGGEKSGVQSDTTEIVIESANFAPSSIRRTSTRLGLRTDAAMRFEKSLDPNLCPIALARAVELIVKVCPGAEVVTSVTDVKKFNLPVGPISVDYTKIDSVIGAVVDRKEINRILTALGFELKEKKTGVSVKIPTWRATKDVGIAEDIAEEVLRIWGYANVAPAMPKFSITPPEQDARRHLVWQVRDSLSLISQFSELKLYSFVSPDTLKKLNINPADCLTLDNPIAKDRPFLRPSIIVNLLEALESNLHRYDRVAIYEIGRVFDPNGSGPRTEKNSPELLPSQNVKLGIVYSAKGNEQPYFAVKEALRQIANESGLEFKFVKPKNVLSYAHSGRTAEIFVGAECVGVIAELHPANAKAMGISVRASFAEIDLDICANLRKSVRKYIDISEFPQVTRDMAIIVPRNVQHADIVAAIMNTNSLVTRVKLFDVYEGEKIDVKKKSVAYHITLGAGDHTLGTEEIENVLQMILKTLRDKFTAELRS